MSRYIGVDMLRTVTDNFRFLHTGNYDYDSGFGDCVSRIESLMRNYSTADVTEVKHGEWTKDDSDGCFCSFCGWYTDYDYDYVTNNGLDNDDFIYCSHCGARMDGGEE